MVLATRFVQFWPAHHDARTVHGGGAAIDDALAIASRLLTYHAVGYQPLDLDSGDHVRHGFKGLAEKVPVQTGDDDPPSLIGQNIADAEQAPVEKLDLVDGDYGGVFLQEGEDLVGRLYRSCFQGHSPMGLELREPRILSTTGIDPGIEHLHLVSVGSGIYHSVNEFLRLAAEHGAGQHFDTACFDSVHVCLLDVGELLAHGCSPGGTGRVRKY